MDEGAALGSAEGCALGAALGIPLGSDEREGAADIVGDDDGSSLEAKENTNELCQRISKNVSDPICRYSRHVLLH